MLFRGGAGTYEGAGDRITWLSGKRIKTDKGLGVRSWALVSACFFVCFLRTASRGRAHEGLGNTCDAMRAPNWG